MHTHTEWLELSPISRQTNRPALIPPQPFCQEMFGTPKFSFSLYELLNVMTPEMNQKSARLRTSSDTLKYIDADLFATTHDRLQADFFLLSISFLPHNKFTTVQSIIWELCTWQSGKSSETLFRPSWDTKTLLWTAEDTALWVWMSSFNSSVIRVALEYSRILKDRI